MRAAPDLAGWADPCRSGAGERQQAIRPVSAVGSGDTARLCHPPVTLSDCVTTPATGQIGSTAILVHNESLRTRKLHVCAPTQSAPRVPNGSVVLRGRGCGQTFVDTKDERLTLWPFNWHGSVAARGTADVIPLRSCVGFRINWCLYLSPYFLAVISGLLHAS